MSLTTSQEQLSTEGLSLPPPRDIWLAQSWVCLCYWDLEVAGWDAAKHNTVYRRLSHNRYLPPKVKGTLMRSPTAEVSVLDTPRDGGLGGRDAECAVDFPRAAVTLMTITS